MSEAADTSPTESDCCASRADPRIARHFDEKIRRLAADDLPPLHDVSRAVLESLSDVGDVTPSVLELGCGSGALSVSLLERGASSVSGVDLSPASVEAARRRATGAGVAERAAFSVGDGAIADVPARDWVVLDRVICCYRDVDSLLANSIGAARRRYAFSVPVSSGWRGVANRLVVRLEAATSRWRGRPCPGYVHDGRRIHEALRRAGFQRLRGRRAGMWQIAVYERPAS